MDSDRRGRAVSGRGGQAGVVRPLMDVDTVTMLLAIALLFVILSIAVAPR